MQATRLLLVVALVLATLSTVARAEENPYITVTGCETTIVNGQDLTRVSFRLRNASPYVLTLFTVSPDYTQPADTCWALADSSPDHWLALIQDGGVAYYRTGGDYVLGPGETLEGFSLTYAHSPCCVAASFANGLGIFDYTQLCLQCPLATPVRPASWGSLKATYR